MYAVLLRLSIESARMEDSVEFLKTNVLPMARQMPGIVGGYWLSPPEGGEGMALTIFESEDTARASMEAMDHAPRPDYVTFTGAQLLRVDGSL